MHRFFLLDCPIYLQRAIDLTPLAHQLHTVLRLRPDDTITLLDGHANAYTTQITQLNRHSAMGFVLAQHPVDSEPNLHLTLYQCSLKADKFEWVVQKGTELGAARFVPVISERSIVRPAAALRKKYPRWKTIIREAAEQSGRGRLPTLDGPLTWTEAVAHAQGAKLLPWEACAESMPVPKLGQVVVRYAQDATPPTALNLLIGPEGGVSPDEAEQARVYGWQTVSLGPRILRAETAAVASVAVVLGQLD